MEVAVNLLLKNTTGAAKPSQNDLSIKVLKISEIFWEIKLNKIYINLCNNDWKKLHSMNLEKIFSKKFYKNFQWINTKLLSKLFMDIL